MRAVGPVVPGSVHRLHRCCTACASFDKRHASAFFSSCLAPSELLYIILRPLACRPIDMLLACSMNVFPCLPSHGAMQDYDLHWTDTLAHDLDICEPGGEEEWFAFYRTQTEEEGGVFAPIGQEASQMLVSEAPDGQRWWGFWNTPSLWRRRPWLGTFAFGSTSTACRSVR